MKNPIINNRLVSNKTFALRFLIFALETQCADACSEDEKEAMISHGTKLLKYQIKTAIDKNEIDYLENCNAKEVLKRGLNFLK